MIRHCILRPLTGRGIAVGAALLFCAIGVEAYGGNINVAVLLQQTPTKGGAIIPEAGVHQFALNTQVVVTAVPRPGYVFMYWLGEVTDPTSGRTTVHIDRPKIIVAVFQRSQYVIPQIVGGGGGQSRSGGASTSRSGLFGSAVDFGEPQGDVGSSGGGIGTSGSTSGGNDLAPPPPWPPETPTEPPGPINPPVPPVPEPTTALLMLTGSMLLLPRRRTV